MDDNLFDDPEFLAQLGKRGIVHKPGMAKRLMDELAPLMRADGVDPSDLGDTDFDEFAAAMDRATERHNLALFTPTGSERRASVGALARFSLAISENDQRLAERMLEGIQPEPQPGVPAISHVIGVAMGLLDTWLTDVSADAALRASTDKMRVPRWRENRARAAATDVIALARKGRSFDSLSTLHRSHSGLFIFYGSALAVAATAQTLAEHAGATVAEIFAPHLGARQSDANKPANAGASFGRAARAPRGLDPAVVAQFGEWLEVQPEILAPNVDSALTVFALLVDIARQSDIDIIDPDSVDQLIEEIIYGTDDDDEPDHDNSELKLVLLSVYLDFALFRLDEAPEDELWEEAADQIQDALDDFDVPESVLSQAIEAEADIDENELLAALLAVPLVAAVPSLLEWLGDSRPVTTAGGIKRADLHQVGRLIGINVVGVSKRPADAEGNNAGRDASEPIAAISMQDVPLLTAWWEALIVADVIKITPTRVRPGPSARLWSLGAEPTIEVATLVAMSSVSNVLTSLLLGRADDAIFATEERIDRVIWALGPEANENEANEHEASTDPLVLVVMEELRAIGLVGQSDDGHYVVPDNLRGVVARGVLSAIAVVDFVRSGY